jgi:uncharacterized protein YndB with AHSA1/START domain
MTAVASGLDQLTLDITEEILVRAPIDKAFAALLEELGPANRGHNDTPMPMMLEAWPGGRWFRDLGNGNGHFWGVVQAIKAPALLEITGPMMMSFAVASNVQYRLKEADGGTLITLHHSALGLFPDGFQTPLSQGWRNIFDRLRRRLEP